MSFRADDMSSGTVYYKDPEAQTLTKPRNSKRSLQGIPSTPKHDMKRLLIADIDLLCWLL